MTRSTVLFSLCLSFLGCALPASAIEEKAPLKNRTTLVKKPIKPAAPALEIFDETPLIDQSGQQIYQMLLGEIALQRGDTELSSKAYAELALSTKDPRIFERAVEIALYSRQFDVALETLKDWLDLEPDSIRAQQLHISAKIYANSFDDLALEIIRLLKADPQTLADNLAGLNRTFSRSQDKSAAFRVIKEVAAAFPERPEAHYATAMAAGLIANNPELREYALTEIGKALEQQPKWEAAALLEAQIVAQESPTKAIARLQNFLDDNPEARDVQFFLARSLIGERHYPEAKKHFDQLLKILPDNPEIVYLAAVLALQQEDKPLAKQRLLHFLTLDVSDKSNAYYYLGQLAEENKDRAEALAFYSRINLGTHYFPAQMRKARLLGQQAQFEEANAVLNALKPNTPEERAMLGISQAGLLREANQAEAALAILEPLLLEQPEQTDLLYDSALLAEKVGKFNLMEERLRKLIRLNPDNPQAYNALGYAFAERNIKLPEARELIEKALKLAPVDMHILDSMGWVLFRQADLPGALIYLERAYALQDDAEVAAHLAEVLFALNKADAARNLLNSAQEKYPDNPVLQDVLRRFAQPK